MSLVFCRRFMPNIHLDCITRIEKQFPQEPGIPIYPVLINI